MLVSNALGPRFESQLGRFFSLILKKWWNICCYQHCSHESVTARAQSTASRAVTRKREKKFFSSDGRKPYTFECSRGRVRIVDIMGWGRGPIGEFSYFFFDWLDYPEVMTNFVI